MEGLSLDNVWGEQELENLFTDTEETPAGEPEGGGAEEQPEEDNKNDKPKETTEVDPEELFEEEDKPKDKPESVGSEKDKDKEKGGSSADDGGGTSPSNDVYSSIAIAMAEDGIFPNLDEERVKKVDTAEGISDLIEEEVNARLDEKQRRISKALENGVEPSSIRMYEGTLSYLSKISEQQISEESENGEKLRYRLIYQDFVNKGMSPEKAEKLTKRSIDAGNDIEDAKEALQSNRDFFQKEYDKVRENAQKEADEDRAERQKRSEQLKESIMKDKTLMGDMEISTDVRRKVLENISKAVYKDLETGEYMTAIQKYEREHPTEFLKYAGLFMTLTNGFKDFETFMKGKIKKAEKKGLSNLGNLLAGTRRDSNGNLKMRTTVQDDPDSYIGRGWKLDI